MEIALIGYVWKLQVGILSSYVNLNILNTKYIVNKLKSFRSKQIKSRFNSNKLMQGFMRLI